MITELAVPSMYYKQLQGIGACVMFTGLHLRIWCNTAKPDVNSLLDNINAWFVLIIKKGATEEDVEWRMETVDIAEINL